MVLSRGNLRRCHIVSYHQLELLIWMALAPVGRCLFLGWCVFEMIASNLRLKLFEMPDLQTLGARSAAGLFVSLGGCPVP